MAKDGSVWTVIQLAENRRRQQSQNVMTEEQAPQRMPSITLKMPSMLFCLVDGGMLMRIRDCTVGEAHRVKEDSSRDITVDELKAFIVLVYIHGAQG